MADRGDAAERLQSAPSGEDAAAHLPDNADTRATSLPLSVIIPVYNEENLISEVLHRVQSVPIRKQIIVVDDGSTDGTVGVVQRIREKTGDLLIVHQAMINMGKGTAIRIGLRYAAGDIILIQDADMEYDPDDYPALLAPIQRGEADVVYGVRFHRPVKGMLLRYRLANWVFAATASMLYGRLIRDEATAYKAFRREVLLSLDLHASRFEFCPEVTAKVCKRGYRLAQVPITYMPRTFAEGKKIGWRDGVHTLWTLFRYRLFD
ncbi:MAG: glycosyl transferase [Dehalococcoidia bacterium]|nr:glycosyl transferase [Dehalococcoidia bacterium]